MHAFLHTKQNAQTVDAYALSFRHAIMLAGKIPERLSVAHFIDGLHNNLAAEVSRQVPTTLTEAIRLARWTEHAARMARGGNQGEGRRPQPGQ